MRFLGVLFASPRRAILVVVGVIVFLGISGELARWLSLENTERDDILAVLRARGARQRARDARPAAPVQLRLPADVRYDARALKRPGQVLILADESQTAYALTSSEGWTRVAWKAGTALPVVQCFKVLRKGNAISGLTVTLLRVGASDPGRPPIAERGASREPRRRARRGTRHSGPRGPRRRRRRRLLSGADARLAVQGRPGRPLPARRHVAVPPRRRRRARATASRTRARPRLDAGQRPQRLERRADRARPSYAPDGRLVSPRLRAAVELARRHLDRPLRVGQQHRRRSG